MAHVTTMVLKVVDLQGKESFKKVKHVLCSFDEIQDQVYDRKENKVTIKVASSDPEAMKQKILSRGTGVIKSIDIIVPEGKKKADEPPPPPPPPPTLGVPVPSVPFVPLVPVYLIPVAGTCFCRTCCQECHEGHRDGPCFHGPNYNFGRPPPCYDDRYNGNWGKPVLNYDSHGGERGNYFQPSLEYCSEPASGCQFM